MPTKISDDLLEREHRPEDGGAKRDLSLSGFLFVAFVAFIVTWGAVWLYIVVCPMAYAGRDYPLSIAKANLSAQCRPNEIAVFGDSRAVAGVLPTAMDVNVENLAFPAASPVETYFAVARLLRCPVPPRLVVIAHSASMYPEDKYFWSVFAGIGVLNATDIRAVEANATALGDNELVSAERPKAVPFAILPELYAMRFPPLYFGNVVGGYVAARWRYNERALREATLSSGRSSFGMAEGSDAISDEAKMNDWRVSPLINLYFDRTIKLLALHHVPVVIITMPINAATCARLPPVVQSRFSAYLNGIAKANPNVELVDSTIPCWPNAFYGDAWHFNMSGTLAYSQKLQLLLAGVLNDHEETQKFQIRSMVAAESEVPARTYPSNGGADE